MPLFDINTALSPEVKAAHQLAERLSELTAIQNLAETTNAADALAKIVVGIDTDPFDGDVYTLEELEHRHFIAHVYSEREAGHAAVLGPETMGNPHEGATYFVYLCRQIRESEDAIDAYNFFWDRISAIGIQLIPAAEALQAGTYSNRFTRVLRTAGPIQGQRKAEGMRGRFLEAQLRISWGDVEEE